MGILVAIMEGRMSEKKEYPEYDQNPLIFKIKVSLAEIIISVNCFVSILVLLNKHCW